MESMKDLVKFATEIVSEHPWKNIYHAPWGLADAFYLGNQYNRIDENNQVVAVKTKREAKCVYNIVKPFVDVFCNKLLKDVPIPQVLPYSNVTERSDDDKTLLFNTILEYYFSHPKNKLMENWYLAARYGALYGIAFTKQYWDDFATMGDLGTSFKGDFKIEVIKPEHCYPDHLATSTEAMAYFIHAYPVRKDVVSTVYKVKREDLKSDVEDIMQYKNTYIRERKSASEDYSHHTMLYDVYIAPCPEWPKGVHAIVCSGKIMPKAQVDFPYTIDEVFKAYTPQKNLDSIVGVSMFSSLMNVQIDLNKTNSQIMENMKWTGNHKYFVSKLAGLKPGSMTDEAGEIVFVNEQFYPQLPNVPALPNYIVSRPEVLIRDAQLTSKVQEVSFGQIPYRGNQTSGAALQLLDVNQETNFLEEVRNFSSFLKAIAVSYVRMAIERYDLDRWLYICGRDKLPIINQVLNIDSEKLTVYDIDVEVGSGFGAAPAARYEQLLALFQYQVFDKVGIDPSMVAEELLKLGNVNRVSQRGFAHKVMARKYLEMTRRGEQYAFSAHADLGTYIQVFIEFVNSPEYLSIDDQEKMRVDAQIDAMKQLQQQQAMQNMQQQMMMQQMVQGMMQQGQPQAGGNSVPFRNNNVVGLSQEAQGNLSNSPGAPVQGGFGGAEPAGG